MFVEETPTFPVSIMNIITQEWLNIEKFYSNTILDEFVVMPNHIHGIIGFLGTPTSLIHNKETNLSNIISTFKSITNKQIKKTPFENGKQELSATNETMTKHNTI